MSTSVLATIAVTQGLFLLLLLILLLTRRMVVGFHDGRGRQYAALATRAAGRWLAGDADEEHLRLALSHLSFAHLGALLQRLSMQLGGDDWEKLSRTVRRTAWFEKVRLRAGSRLWWRRLQTARALMVVGNAEDGPLVEKLLRDDRPAVRRAAVWCLQRVQSPVLAALVLDMAPREPRVLRAQILEILTGSRAYVLGPLIESLRSSTEREALRTALALSERLGVPGLLEHLLPHADHPDMEIRIAAARSLAAYPHARSSQALVRLLRDPAWQVRAQAAAALGSIGAREAAGDLNGALSDPSWWVRLRSALALRRMGGAGVSLLEKRRPDDDRYAYEMAQYILRLDAAAVAEYAGAYVVDYSEAPASEHAA